MAIVGDLDEAQNRGMGAEWERNGRAGLDERKKMMVVKATIDLKRSYLHVHRGALDVYATSYLELLA